MGRRLALPTLVWGGLRGGISIALALSLPEGPARTVMLAATYIIVLFSVIVQGGTIDRLVNRFAPRRSHLDGKLTAQIATISAEVAAITTQLIRRMFIRRAVTMTCASSRPRTAEARRSASKTTRIAIQEGRRDGARQPGWLDLAEQDVEGEADADRGQSCPQPAGEGPLIGEDRAILRQICCARRTGSPAIVGFSRSPRSERIASPHASAQLRQASGADPAMLVTLRHGGRIPRRTSGRSARKG